MNDKQVTTQQSGLDPIAAFLKKLLSQDLERFYSTSATVTVIISILIQILYLVIPLYATFFIEHFDYKRLIMKPEYLNVGVAGFILVGFLKHTGQMVTLFFLEKFGEREIVYFRLLLYPILALSISLTLPMLTVFDSSLLQKIYLAHGFLGFAVLLDRCVGVFRTPLRERTYLFYYYVLILFSFLVAWLQVTRNEMVIYIISFLPTLLLCYLEFK